MLDAGDPDDAGFYLLVLSLGDRYMGMLPFQRSTKAELGQEHSSRCFMTISMATWNECVLFCVFIMPKRI